MKAAGGSLFLVASHLISSGYVVCIKFPGTPGWILATFLQNNEPTAVRIRRFPRLPSSRGALPSAVHIRNMVQRSGALRDKSGPIPEGQRIVLDRGKMTLAKDCVQCGTRPCRIVSGVRVYLSSRSTRVASHRSYHDLAQEVGEGLGRREILQR